MKNFLKRALKKENDFYDMLTGQSQKTLEGMTYLLEFMKNPSEENGKKVENAEEEADELRRLLIDNLNRAFITPFDREDIFALSRALDDVIDYAETTVDEMMVLNILPDEHIKEMVTILHEATKEIDYAVKHIKRHPNICHEHTIRAQKAENKVEKRYRRALADLFETNDVIRILKTREVYRHLSNAADRIATAANIISDILVKNT